MLSIKVYTSFKYWIVIVARDNLVVHCQTHQTMNSISTTRMEIKRQL